MDASRPTPSSGLSLGGWHRIRDLCQCLHGFCAAGVPGAKGPHAGQTGPAASTPALHTPLLVSCSRKWLGILDKCLWSSSGQKSCQESKMAPCEICGASSASAPRSERPPRQWLLP